ncbi:jg1180, partial [Pararge aegeria aegeria]
ESVKVQQWRLPCHWGVRAPYLRAVVKLGLRGIGRCGMGRAARRREMLLAASAGAGDGGVVAGAAAGGALRATDAHGTPPLAWP